MPALRIRALFFFAFLAACGPRACSVGDSLTLLLGGADAVASQAQVLKDGEPIGYVDAVTQESTAQRIEFRVREAGLIHNRDTFRVARGAAGKAELHITHIGGEPIAPGTLLYFPLRDGYNSPPVKREPEKESGGFFSFGAKKNTPVEPEPYEEPYYDDPDAPVISFKEDTHARRSIRQGLASIQEAAAWPPQVQSQVKSLIRETQRPGDEKQVITEVGRRLPKIRDKMASIAREAHQNGDQRTAREAINAVQKLTMLHDRLDHFKRSARPVAPAEEGGEAVAQ